MFILIMIGAGIGLGAVIYLGPALGRTVVMEVVTLLIVLFIGVIIGQLSVWCWLGVPLAKDGKEVDEWVQFLKDCVHDRKLEQSWFD